MFKLEIQLGNAAMQTGADIAAALQQVAYRLAESYDDATAEWGGLSHGIMDSNGNNVGRWEIGA